MILDSACYGVIWDCDVKWESGTLNLLIAWYEDAVKMRA
jgi:hypothetical protein